MSSSIQTYNIMGSGFEGFAVPVGLLRMPDAFQLGGGSINDFSKMRIPDVTNVDAISHDLYEKLFKLSQFDNSDEAIKKHNKSRKNKLSSSSRKSKKIKG
jgi:hypothetical protein